MRHKIHIIPVGGDEPVQSSACWCHPLEGGSSMSIHHAKDAREAAERQGFIAQDRPWCLVYENLPNDHRQNMDDQNTTHPECSRPASRIQSMFAELKHCWKCACGIHEFHNKYFAPNLNAYMECKHCGELVRVFPP